MVALLRSLALCLCLALLLGAVAGVSAARASGAELSFTNPTAEHSYHVVGKAFQLSWQESVGGGGRRLVEEQALLDVNGACFASAWRSAGSSTPRGLSVELQLRPDRCYRWTLSLTVGETTHSVTSGAVRTLAAWSGTYNLYGKGVFSTQRKWDWCVAASAQMMFNMILDETDHSRAGQKQYYLYARAHDLTPDRIPGADPRGWALALRHFGGGNYSDVSSPTFKSALRQAARRMRLTGKPVGILARAGDHAMVLNGFTASADPATALSFDVTAVYIMGPLYPDSPKYDPPPNSRFTAAAFKRKYFQRYDNPFGSAKWSVWEGSFVTINP